jgi:hypothetical protein
MATGTQLGFDPGNFYIWRASDGFAIHLSLKVVRQLTAQISRAGNESQPSAMRGILLGRKMDTPIRATVIEDFKLIPASTDPAAQTVSDDALFEIACRMVEGGTEQRVVGFLRVQRDGTLNMGPRDLHTFSRLFCETGNVALLIQTPRRGESDAALFYWEQGGAHPRDFGFGFPFEADQLASGHPGWRFANPFVQTEPAMKPAPAPTPEVAQATAAPASSSGERIRWSRLAPTAVIVLIAIGALQLATSSRNTTAASTSSSDNAPAVQPDTPLGLRVTSRPHQLEIRWNRASPTIAASDQGVMRITEAGTTEAVPFDQDQLHDGYVAYTPKTNDVNIRLEVTGKDGSTTSESVRSVAIP